MLVRVRAAGVDPGIWHLVRGEAYLGRLVLGLVIGASGGVGTFAVQIAATYGAHVTAVCVARVAPAWSAPSGLIMSSATPPRTSSASARAPT